MAMIRYHLPSGRRFWYIADKYNLDSDDQDYYRIASNQETPPTAVAWGLARDGVSPGPTLTIQNVVEVQPRAPRQCPICNVVFNSGMGLEEINTHIDECLLPRFNTAVQLTEQPLTATTSVPAVDVPVAVEAMPVPAATATAATATAATVTTATVTTTASSEPVSAVVTTTSDVVSTEPTALLSPTTNPSLTTAAATTTTTNRSTVEPSIGARGDEDDKSEILMLRRLLKEKDEQIHRLNTELQQYKQQRQQQQQHTPATKPAETVAVPSGQQEGEQEMCCICMARAVDSVCIPCGHICMCTACGEALRFRGHDCPLCRQGIRAVQKVYLV